MYYYGGYQGGYGCYPNYGCCSYPTQGGFGYGAAIIIVLFILLVIVIGCRHNI